MNASSKVCQALELVASTWGSVFLLDGGTGEELLARGIPVDRKIWSATAIVNSCYHSTLLQVHRSYLDSGAQAITTNSYGIVPGVGFTDEEIVQHCSAAGRLARQAIEEYEHDHHSITDAINDNYKCNSHDYVSHNKIEPFALGSLGPLVESYRPDKVMVRDRGVAVYSRMVSAMAPYVDAFLAETLSSTEEAMQVIESLASTDCRNTLPLLISFTVNSEGNLRSGETVVGSLSRVLQCSLQHHVKLVAFLFNCSEPEAITKSLQSIRTGTTLTGDLQSRCVLLGAYANRLTPVEVDWSLSTSSGQQMTRSDLSPEQYYKDFVAVWVKEFNVKVVGGCCGISPRHIAYLRDNLPVKPR